MSHVRRWGLLWATVGVAVVLVASTLWIYLGLRAHADEVAHIHGEYVVSQLPAAPSELDDLLHALRPMGAMSISRFDADGRWVGTAGEAVEPDARGAATAVHIARGRYRIEHPEGEGFVVLEYAPLLAMDLHRRASIALATSVMASGLLVLSAVLWLRSRLQLEAAELAAERSRHLAHLGTLSSVVAHELRNPLMVLLGHVQLLREDLPDNARVQHVEDGAMRLDELLDSLLRFARTGELSLELVDPAELVRLAVAHAGVRGVTVQGTAPEWPLDRMRMRQVLVNLLRNARAASPEGTVAARVSVQGGRLVIEVEDDGEGVAAEDRERVFEPFFTTRSQGTGLGLAVARDIVGKHGGSLTLHDAPTGGALFRIEVPA